MRQISSDQLTRLALSKGVAVQVGGKTINAGKQRVDVQRHAPAEPPKPEPIAPPPPPPTVDHTEQLAALVATLVKEVRAERTAAPAPVIGWTFDVVRDSNDRLVQIKAKAQR